MHLYICAHASGCPLRRENKQCILGNNTTSSEKHYKQWVKNTRERYRDRFNAEISRVAAHSPQLCKCVTASVSSGNVCFDNWKLFLLLTPLPIYASFFQLICPECLAFSLTVYFLVLSLISTGTVTLIHMYTHVYFTGIMRSW